MIRDWLGIPEGYVSPRLSFEPTAKVIVVEFHSRSFGANFLPTRLFTRSADKSDYRPVVNWEKTLSSESVVFAGDGVFAAFNSVRYMNIKDDSVSADWNGVYLWNLRTDDVRCCADSNTLVIGPGFKRGFITNLTGLSSDAKQLYVQVGLQNGAGRVFYHIAALNIETKAVDSIAELKSTFY